MGAVIAHALKRKAPQAAEEYTFPVASGIIAGGSLMGVVIVFWENGGDMLAKFLGR